MSTFLDYCGVEIASLINNTEFPECMDKLNWMQAGWKTHTCYSEHGVNGSKCSFYEYMAKREHFCPIPAGWSGKLQEYKLYEVSKKPALKSLFDIMTDSKENYEFIQSRIERLWTNWQEAHEQLVQKRPDVETRRIKNVSLNNLVVPFSKLT
jgi:hypothetical protein